jgi:hypothetical protein
MFGKHAFKNIRAMVATAALLGSALTALVPLAAFADYEPTQGEIRSLRTPLIPGAPWTPQLQAAPEGQPPPIGDGDFPMGVTTGDMSPQAPPTGFADPTHGNIFPTRGGPPPKDPAIYVPDAGRNVTKNGQQQGVFDQGIQNNGTKTTNNGGEKGGSNTVENNGGPSPNAVGKTDRTFTHDIQPSRYDFEGPLPTVRVFCRYLVILGVVAGTVWVSMAGMSVVLGVPHSGGRVIGAAGGLLLLLGGYTIWKIVQMNTFHANSTGWESHYRDGTPQPLSQRGTGGAPAFAGPVPPTAGPTP